MRVCLYNDSVFFFKQKTAYEMRISDWSSDVCSSDLAVDPVVIDPALQRAAIDGVVHVRQHDGGGVHPVAVDLQIVADQLPRGIGEVALHPQIVEQPARRRVEAGDAAGGGAHRNADAVGVDHGAPAGLQILDAGGVEGDLPGGDVKLGRAHV